MEPIVLAIPGMAKVRFGMYDMLKAEPVGGSNKKRRLQRMVDTGGLDISTEVYGRDWYRGHHKSPQP